MTKYLFRATAIFFILIVATAVMVDVLKVDLGTTDFWQVHSIFFLFFITIFPRLTLIISSVPFGGLFWWLGFFFCPRVLVASLATVTYFHTNPILVVISWVVALGGEVFEKWGVGRQKFVFRTYNMGSPQGSPFPYSHTPEHASTVAHSDAIETTFVRKD